MGYDSKPIAAFTDKELREELDRRGIPTYDTDGEALAAIADRVVADHLREAGFRVLENDDLDIDENSLNEARARLMRGEVMEGLLWIERALPYGFPSFANRVRPS